MYETIVCKNSLAHVITGNLIRHEPLYQDQPLDISDSEKSEIADKAFEDFVGILEAKASASAEDFAKLRSLFSKASKLAYAAGIEHERCNHSCKGHSGAFFG